MTITISHFTLAAGIAQAGDQQGEGGCLRHCCRQPIRRLLGGQTTKVRRHWRGDAGKGVSTSRYRVATTGATEKP